MVILNKILDCLLLSSCLRHELLIFCDFLEWSKNIFFLVIMLWCRYSVRVENYHIHNIRLIFIREILVCMTSSLGFIRLTSNIQVPIKILIFVLPQRRQRCENEEEVFNQFEDLKTWRNRKSMCFRFSVLSKSIFDVEKNFKLWIFSKSHRNEESAFHVFRSTENWKKSRIWHF